MNLLEVHVIFIHIKSDQQLSGIFPSLQKKNFHTRSYRHFKIENDRYTLSIPRGSLVIDNHSYVLHTHFTSLSDTHLKTEFLT